MGGAGGGLGRSYALYLAERGAKVVVNDLGGTTDGQGNDSKAADKVVAEIKAAGGQAVANYDSVSTPPGGENIVKTAIDAFGRVDIVINNAGILRDSSILKMPTANFDILIDVHLKGAFYVTQAVARQMKEQGTGGAIVATSSISALVGGGMQTHYTPTKAGVHSLMQSCAIALGPYGIRCNSVMPGTIATDLNAEDLADEAKRAYFEKRIPLGRLGAPEDVAECVVFLASERARYVTGAALLVDGGLFVNLQ